ncbi:MAG: SDR family oxidoreductase [Deltaproteobacteria bacterium]|nr:MAG: SDR family oxidoreductase [Deltaproteobacteria bacterium]
MTSRRPPPHAGRAPGYVVGVPRGSADRSPPRIALVTGAASGIGRATVLRLIGRGDRVVAADIDRAGLDGLANHVGPAVVEPAHLDVRDARAWDELVNRIVADHGRLDVLVHAAGILSPTAGHRLDPETIERLVDVNVKGTIHGANAAARAMLPRGRGNIVVVASMAALVPVPGISVYSATKHAARAYALALAQDLRPHGIFVSAVCPAVVATPMMDQQIDAEDAALTFSSRRPLTPEEVARAIVERAIERGRLEVVVQVPGSGQALAAKLANGFPSLAPRLGAFVRRRAARRQAKLRARLRNDPSDSSVP